LKPGMMVVIDNWRVMHGRSGFSGDRRMCGAYVGRDEWRSRLEVLRRRFDTVKGEDGQAGEVEKWRDGW
jgi:trimethyllysine dioxygenase